MVYYRPTFFAIRKNSSVGQQSGMPYLAALFNCAVWILYALPMVHANNKAVLIISTIGALIEIGYVLIYIYYAVGLVRCYVMMGLFLEIIIGAVVAPLLLVVVQSHKVRSIATGVLGVISSIAMYASPIGAVVCHFALASSISLSRSQATQYVLLMHIHVYSFDDAILNYSIHACIVLCLQDWEGGAHWSHNVLGLPRQLCLLGYLRVHTTFRPIHSGT